MNLMDEVLYNETLSDFASAIEAFGVRRVSEDFKRAFPDFTDELIRCLSHKEKQVPALLKP